MMFFFPPEAESHQQETQKLDENKENAQDTIIKSNKKNFLSYGENKTGLTAVLIHIQKSSEKISRKLADLNSFNVLLICFKKMFDNKYL